MIKEINTFHSGRYTFNSDLIGSAVTVENILSFLDNTPLFPDTVQHLKDFSKAQLVYSNGLVEKSSITFDQVKGIISHDRSNFSQDTSAVETINLYSAAVKLDKLLSAKLTQELIHDIHNELIEGLSGLKDRPNQYRNGGIKADEQWLKTPYTPVGSTLDINFILKNLIEWIESPEMAKTNPVIKGILLHLNIKKIQPYNNANGHTARLMELWFLKKSGYETIANLLSEIYSNNVEDYYSAMSDFYETSDPTSFFAFVGEKLNIIFGEIKAANEAIIRKISIDYYVDKLLTDKSLIKRQHAFIKLIKDEEMTFTQEDLQLKKDFIKLYGKVSRTTVARDITKFCDMNLVIESEDGFSFNYDLLKF